MQHGLFMSGSVSMHGEAFLEADLIKETQDSFWDEVFVPLEVCFPAWQSPIHSTYSNLLSNLSSLPGIISVFVKAVFSQSNFRIC